jgi:hexulose-6-phosphate isomerase
MTPGECTAFIEAVARPNIGIYLDVANVLYSGYPQDFIRELGSRLVRIHAKDRTEPDASGKGRATWPGNGVADWNAVRAACAETGYDAWAVLEFPPAAGQSYNPEGARIACDGARAAFGA